ncbi:MAG: methyltransferase domain-containing protein [Bacillota bacterium]|nr:methyltransferase domain-containing protein [Bacillota bacterium]
MHTRVWDFWASRYERLWVQKHSLTPTRELVIEELSGLIDSGREYKLLDMGCGTGQLIREIQQAFPHVKLSCVGVDISPKMIEMAAANNPGTFFMVSSIEGVIGEGEFDIVVCTHSFPYYRDQAKALRKLSTMLKPGGNLLLAQASVNSPYDALVMFLVKFTTGKASYPSIAAVKQWPRPTFPV